MRKLSIIGLAISMTFILSACSGQAQAETNPTPAMETTVSETTTEAETTEVMTSSESGFNKEVYELLKLNWVNGIYEDETELRAQAPIILGSISEENLEIIIQELLSLDRGQNTTQSESLTETKPVESTKTPAPTQAPQPTQAQAVEPTQAPEPQQTTPAPQVTQAETQSQVNNTPPAAISQEEEDAIWEEAGLGGTPNVTISDGITLDPDAGEGYNWH